MNEQTISKIMLVLIPVALGLLLFGLPLAYSIWRCCWWKTLLLTWLIWVVYGMCVPALATLHEKLSGEPPDFDGLAFFVGIMFGWLPGLIFAFIGNWIHGLIQKRKEGL